jgi:hypothetical protein
MSNKQTLKNLLEFGIDLALNTDDENIYYALEFASYVQDSLEFDSVMKSESEIEVFNYEEKILTVIIENGILTIEPHSEEGAFDAVLLVLRFISEQHELVKERYSKLSIEDSSEEPEEESEEDSEWI